MSKLKTKQSDFITDGLVCLSPHDDQVGSVRVQETMMMCDEEETDRKVMRKTQTHDTQDTHTHIMYSYHFHISYQASH